MGEIIVVDIVIVTTAFSLNVDEVPWSYRKDDSKLFEEVEPERDPLQQLTRESLLQEG